MDTAADDVALIAFTSGTTGKPKGTMHFHRDVVAMCDLFPRSCLRTRADDIFCGTPPLAFTFGLGGMLAFPMRYGASTVLVERLTPEALLETIQDFRATVCFTAPTFYRQMAGLAKNYDLGSLERCVSAGEALPDATRQLFKSATGIEIIDGIGSTEMIHIFISHTPERARRGATGYAIPGYEATVLDEKARRCAPGVVGRLAVRGATGCRYLADERQKNYVISEGEMRGWNVTGDAYSMDADGYFFYQSRTDDMIISAGYNIAGPEVEGALLAHPAVAGMRRGGHRGRRARPDREGFRGAQARPCEGWGDGEGAAGSREELDRALQVSARDRVPRCAAAHRDRKTPTLQTEDAMRTQR